MSYTALETCAVAADLNQRIADMHQTLDSLKSKADSKEREHWRARQNAVDTADLIGEFSSLAALGLAPSAGTKLASPSMARSFGRLSGRLLGRLFGGH